MIRRLSKIAALVLLSATALFAQGVRKDDFVINQAGKPIPNAAVTVCLTSATIVNGVCTPATTVYSDVAETLPITQPILTGPIGNFGFYATPGEYIATVTGSTITSSTIHYSIPCSPSATVSGCVPGGGGASLTADNTWTTNQRFKGADPWYDISTYGTYISGTSPTSTTATTTSGLNTITVSNAIDFAVGQGIRIAQAGPAASLSSPPTPTITPINITGGGTTWAYQVAAEDYVGGLTAASSAGQTTTGQAALGVTSLALASVARVSGVTTYTLQAPLSTLSAGQTVLIAGFANNSFNGVLTVASVPLTTTFTVNQVGLIDFSETNSSTTASVLSCNRVSETSGSVASTIDTAGSGVNVLRYWYWRSKSGGAYSLVGVAIGGDPYFEDCGFDVNTGRTPDYIPSTPPVSAQHGYLATTITHIAGTTFTLAANAGNGVSGSLTLHDNGPNIVAAATALGTAGIGGRIFLPSGTNANPYYVVNSLVDLRTSNIGSTTLDWVIQGWMQVNQPILTTSNSTLEGLASIGGFSFNYGPQAFVIGNAIPIIFIRPSVSAPITLKNLKITAVGNQSAAVFADNTPAGAGSSGIIFDQAGLGYGDNSYGSPVTLKGGVDYIFKNGPTCSAHTGVTWNGSPGCLRFTNSSTAYNPNPGGSQVPGRVQFDNLYCSVLCVQIDTIPSDGTGGVGPPGTMGAFNFKGGIFENDEGPFLRLKATGPWGDFTINDVQMADALTSGAIPIFDAEGTTSFSPPITFINTSTLASAAPALVVDSTNATCRALYLQSYIGVAPGNCPNYTAFIPSSGVPAGGPAAANGLSGAYQYLNNGQAIASGNIGKFGYTLAAPTGASASAAAGGSWPTGTWYFAWSAVDINGYETALSAPFTLTVSTGSQTISATCSGTTPTVAVKGYNLYSSNGGGYARQNTSPKATCSDLSFTSNADGSTFASVPANATVASIDTNGVTSYKTTSASVVTGNLNGNCIVDGVRNPTLAAAITCAGSSGVIEIPMFAVPTLTANATIPAGVTLRFDGPSSINTTGFTLTVNGPIVAGNYQIFAGSGTVVLGANVNPVFPQWFPGATADVQLNAAVTAMTTGGTLDARGYGASTQTIAATVNVGTNTGSGKAITLMVDRNTTFSCTITNTTPCIVRNAGSTMIAFGTVAYPNAGLILAGTAVVSDVLLAQDNIGSNLVGGFIEGWQVRGNTGATASDAICADQNTLQLTQWQNTSCAANGTQNTVVMKIYATSGNSVTNPVFHNVSIDGGGATGVRPVWIGCAASGSLTPVSCSIVYAINFYGGVITHPGTGGLPIMTVEASNGGGGTNQVDSIGLYGEQFESSNTADIGILDDGANSLHVYGLVASCHTNCGTDLIKLAQPAGTTLDGVDVNGIDLQGAWTNSINNTILTKTISTARVNYHYVKSFSASAANVWDDGVYRELVVDSNGLQTRQVISNNGVACTNAELALSGGWQSTGSATVAVQGPPIGGQTCTWLITTGTTTAANPTITDTLGNPMPNASTCEMNIHGGTHTAVAGEGFTQTTYSATAPVFTFIGTPTANGFTYFVTRRCGP